MAKDIKFKLGPAAALLRVTSWPMPLKLPASPKGRYIAIGAPTAPPPSPTMA